jgi:ABC-type uncharacterized transport system permease subunit
VLGRSPEAARYAGVDAARVTLILAAVAAGAAGLAGVGEVAGIHRRLVEPTQLSLGYGYAAILVALLARGRAWAVVPAALFLGFVFAAGDVMRVSLRLPSQLPDVVTGLVLLLVAASEPLTRGRWVRSEPPAGPAPRPSRPPSSTPRPGSVAAPPTAAGWGAPGRPSPTVGRADGAGRRWLSVDVDVLVIATVARALAFATPLLWAALGEVIAERSGVVNLGVEGMMALGAVTGFAVAYTTGEVWWGLGAAALAGLAGALLHAVVAITLRADAYVSGLSLTMLGLGLSALIGRAWVGRPLPEPMRPSTSRGCATCRCSARRCSRGSTC